MGETWGQTPAMHCDLCPRAVFQPPLSAAVSIAGFQSLLRCLVGVETVKATRASRQTKRVGIQYRPTQWLNEAQQGVEPRLKDVGRKMREQLNGLPEEMRRSMTLDNGKKLRNTHPVS